MHVSRIIPPADMVAQPFPTNLVGLKKNIYEGNIIQFSEGGFCMLRITSGTFVLTLTIMQCTCTLSFKVF